MPIDTIEIQLKSTIILRKKKEKNHFLSILIKGPISIEIFAIDSMNLLVYSPRIL